MKSILSNLTRIIQNLRRKYPVLRKIEPAHTVVAIFLFVTIYSGIIYNSSLKEKRIKEINAFLSNDQTVLLKNYIINKIKSPYLEYEYIVKDNDTIESILRKFSVKQDEVAWIVKKIKKMDLSNIVPKQKIKFILRKAKNGRDIEVVKINYPISKTTFVRIDKRKDGLQITKSVTQLFKRKVLVKGNISNNLYSSAVKAGMEPNIIIEYARIFGFEVDFQRDIRKGDEFQVMYERYFDDRNKKVKTGKILYAYLDVNNQKIKLYRFGKKNNYDFYDSRGRSISKALMKTPINGARLSSPFRMSL